MRLLLDAGALVAAERGDARAWTRIKREHAMGKAPRTHGGVIGQVWRGGARQALLSKLIPGLEIVALDRGLGERAGVLLGRTRMKDVVDAALVALATDRDVIMTSDPDDLAALADAAGLHVDLVAV